MRKRRVQSKTSETLIAEDGDGDGDGDGNIGKEGKGFFACYILVSLSPRHKGQTYIGFTVNPRRRIRQHNGEIGCGAFRTKKKRPWEMVLCIYGFPTNVSALQFEWAWQHPTESLAVRKAAANFKSLSGIANKIKLAYTMLTLPAWESLNITVNYFSTKYKMHSAGCPSLPEHMKVQVFPMDELPCYTKIDESFCENEDDWDNKEECDEASSSGGFVQESPPDSIVRNSADNENNINKKANDTYGWIDGLGEDCIQPFGFSKSPVGTSSSIVSSPFSAEGISEDRDMTKDSSVEGIAEDRDTIKDSSVELRRPARKILTATVAVDNTQPPSSNCFVPCQLEIIDLSTPSPDCRTSLCGKKRRVSIIDLTKSPNFVQL